MGPVPLLDPDKVKVTIEDGTVLTASMFLDKDGNETTIMFDAVKILARHDVSLEWFEIDIRESSWVSHTVQ